MNTITGPVRTTGLPDSFIKDLLEWNEYCTEPVSNLPGHFLVTIKIGIPFLINSFYPRDCKRLTNNKLNIWKSFLSPFKKGYEIISVNIQCAVVITVQFMPEIINTDQDAENIGFEIEAIF